MARDYYEILGIPRNASDKDVRQAYRRLARKHHPDVNLGDKKAEAIFKEINAAYEVLSDPEKRRQYDQFGENWKHADEFTQVNAGTYGTPFFRQGTRAGDLGFHMDDLDLGSIFGEMIGSQRQRGRSRTRVQSTPVEVPMELSLEEAYTGVTRLVQMPMVAAVPARRIEVKVSPGVDTGSRIRVPMGDGNDIYLVVTIRPHRRFTRKGAYLYVDLHIPLLDAILGSEQEVQAIRGKVMLTIPAESQNGQVFRLRNQGMPSLGEPDRKGDLFVSLKVVLPTNLSEREREILHEMKHSRDGKGLER